MLYITQVLIQGTANTAFAMIIQPRVIDNIRHVEEWYLITQATVSKETYYQTSQRGMSSSLAHFLPPHNIKII